MSSAPAPQPPLPATLPAAGRGRRLATLIVLLVALGIGAAFVFRQQLSSDVSTDDAQIDAHITAVSSQVSGYVIKLHVDDNVPVREGDVLVQIDPREYQARVGQAVAALHFAEAEASSARLQIGLTRDTTTHDTGSAAAQRESDAANFLSAQVQLKQAATAELLQAQAVVDARRATYDRARSDLVRYTPLLETQDVSKLQYDAVDTAARVAKSELDAAEQRLAAAKQAVEIASANVNSAKARMARSESQFLETKAQEGKVPITEASHKSALANVERAKAALAQAELNLNYCTIRAPVSGQVTQRTVTLGDYVSSGQLLLTLVPLNEVYVTANFKETQMSLVRPGQRARIHVDTYGADFDGVVDSIAGATGSRQALLPPQNATGNFIKVVQRIPVKILVKSSGDSQHVLRPGMNVEATIYTR